MRMFLNFSRVVCPCLLVISAFIAHAAGTQSDKMIFFNKNTTELSPAAQRILADAAAEAKRQPDYRLEVIDHNDTSSPDEQSLKLSQQRAAETARELVRLGVPANRIFFGGVGSKELLVPTAKGVREAQNRNVRIQFVPISEKNTKAYLQPIK